MIKNKWRAAFWIQSLMYLVTTLFLLYLILDQSVTMAYERDSYDWLLKDLEQLSNIIEGKLNKNDFEEIINNEPYTFDGKTLHLNSTKIIFGPDNKVDSVIIQ